MELPPVRMVDIASIPRQRASQSNRDGRKLKSRHSSTPRARSSKSLNQSLPEKKAVTDSNRTAGAPTASRSRTSSRKKPVNVAMIDLVTTRARSGAVAKPPKDIQLQQQSTVASPRNELGEDNRRTRKNSGQNRGNVRPRDRIGLEEIMFEDPTPIGSKVNGKQKDQCNGRSRSVPTRRTSQAASWGFSLFQARQFASDVKTKMTKNAIDSKGKVDSGSNIESNGGGTGFLGCVPGGQTVGSRFADCLLVTADMYGQDESGPPGAVTNSSFFEGHTTISTVCTDDGLTQLENNVTFESADIGRVRGKNRSIVPQSSISGSSSSGTNNSPIPVKLDVSNTASTSSSSSDSYGGGLRRPPRVLKIATHELEKHGEVQARIYQKAVPFSESSVLRTESPSPIDINNSGGKSRRQSLSSADKEGSLLRSNSQSNQGTIRQSYDSTSVQRAIVPPTQDTISALTAEPSQQAAALRLHQRRPRGSYGNIMGEEIPFDERPGHPNGPMYESPVEYQALRSLRLDMFLQDMNGQQEDALRMFSPDEDATEHFPQPSSPDHAPRQRIIDRSLDADRSKDLSGQDNCFGVVEHKTTEVGVGIEKKFQSALRDLEAQDKIIQNLLTEYEKTKLMLSQAQRELINRNSALDGTKLAPQSCDNSLSKGDQLLDDEDRQIGLMNANQSMHQKFIDLKVQAKTLKGWLTNPEEALDDTSENEAGLLPAIPAFQGSDQTIATSPNPNNPQIATMQPLNSIEHFGSHSAMDEPLVAETEIRRLRDDIVEARSRRLSAVEKLVSLGKSHEDANLDTKTLQLRLERIKRGREDPRTTDKGLPLQVDKMEILRLRDEVGKLTKDLRVANGLCTAHRRKASSLEAELTCTQSEASRLRHQVEDLYQQLQLSKREYDEKSIGEASDAKMLQQEVERIRQNLSSDLNSTIW